VPTRVVLFTGPPGSGKSCLADAVAADLGAPVLGWDWMMSALRVFPSVWESVRDDADLRRDVGYVLMARSLEQQLRRDQPAVLDCVARPRGIERWSELAVRFGAPFDVVECTCSDAAIHRTRIEGRSRDIPGWDELDWVHVERSRTEYVPEPDATIVVDAVEPFEDNLRRVRGTLGLGPEPAP
jgi:predicted kinase